MGVPGTPTHQQPHSWDFICLESTAWQICSLILEAGVTLHASFAWDTGMQLYDGCLAKKKKKKNNNNVRGL